ncbi:Protein of unknown function [Pyronema omphalodes CBS 100304]|uniref:Uncharacterized protein n=1 Tax=Pyronema omphalodes (strain CBS 100304) TaxID=1076935 RepID=U4LFH1_PYROM|nr:Protein of unknown function [Pyronema omphalodes CBS 100304]
MLIAIPSPHLRISIPGKMSSLLKKMFKKSDAKKKEEPPKAPQPGPVAKRNDPDGHLWKVLERGSGSLPAEVVKKKQEDLVKREPDLTTPPGTPVEI